MVKAWVIRLSYYYKYSFVATIYNSSVLKTKASNFSILLGSKLWDSNSLYISPRGREHLLSNAIVLSVLALGLMRSSLSSYFSIKTFLQKTKRNNQHTPTENLRFPAISSNTSALMGTWLVFQGTAGEKLAQCFTITYQRSPVLPPKALLS